MRNEFTIGKVGYTYDIDEKTAIVTREDGRWARFHDDENIVTDWKDALMEMIADNDIFMED